MSRVRLSFVLLALFVAVSAGAQQRPIFDPDDFVDPRQHSGAVFISRLVLGGATGLADDYRPLHQNGGFLHLTNSLYWSRVQLDYKHTEVFAKDHGPARVTVCDNCTPPLYFPSAPPGDATPEAPPPSRKETAQFAWYGSLPGGGASPPIMLRYRLTWSRQQADTIVTSYSTGRRTRRSGHEQSLGLEADTHLRLGEHDVWGTALYARTVRSGTTDDREQQELAYMSRFPAVAVGRVLLRATLTVGGVTGRGASGVNVVNPAFEAFWHDPATRANLHLVWSPQATRSGAEGWKTHHQLALFVDRALYVKLFRPRARL